MLIRYVQKQPSIIVDAPHASLNYQLIVKKRKEEETSPTSTTDQILSFHLNIKFSWKIRRNIEKLKIERLKKLKNKEY